MKSMHDDRPNPQRRNRSRPSRIERTGRRRTMPIRWNIEMLEYPLLDANIAYSVHDTEVPGQGGIAAACWIDFTRPTQVYRNPTGHHEVTVRLTVNDGCLAMTAPGIYPPGSLLETTDPPREPGGDLRVLRLGDDDQTQIDLIMAADGFVTALLRMETIHRPFNRQDIVQIANEFAHGIDLLDFVVHESGLLLNG